MLHRYIPLDSHALEPMHEIGSRFFWNIIVSIVSAIIAGFVLFPIVPQEWEVWIFPPLMGLYISIPEALLRKSLKFGIIAILIGVFISTASFFIMNTTSIHFEYRKQITLIILGGTIGLIGGFGSNSKRSLLFGVIGGCLGGFISGYSWLLIRSTEMILIIKAILILLSQALCISFPIGVAIVLGKNGAPFSSNDQESQGVTQE
ncbi:MAG: hypothetical protein COA79_12535 [Planctomycetota bacterium]|nr:MAG: hypothetical protein COA79_12535 [Planctomycetota bacterium]